MARGTVAAAALLLLTSTLVTAPFAQAQQAPWPSPAGVRGRAAVMPGAGPAYLRIGRIEVHGELTQRIMYDDNIFLEGDSETDDAVFLTTPTVNFVLPGERLNGNVFYSAGLRAFADNEQENSQSQTLSGALVYLTPRGNFFRLQDTYLDTEDLSTSEEQSNIAARAKWHSNMVNATVGLLEIPRLERIDVELGYLFEKRYFDDVENATEDRDNNEFSARCYYDVGAFLPKTRFLVEYVYGTVDFDEGVLVGRDADYHIGRTGISIEPTAKLSGIVMVGVEFRDWEYQVADLTLFNVRTNLRYRYGVGPPMGEVGAVSLTVLREIRESAFRFEERTKPVVEVTRVNVGVQHRINLPVMKVTLPLTLFANFFYEYEDYPGEVLDSATGLVHVREDDFFGGGVRLRLDGRFPGKNLNYFGELGYEVNDRDSNFNIKDYAANRVSLLFGVNF